MCSSKDWSFNQVLAYLRSFLSISAFVSINFCNFVVNPATVSKWVTNTTQPSLEALIAIANALEVPVQELVRQEEFKQEK